MHHKAILYWTGRELITRMCFGYHVRIGDISYRRDEGLVRSSMTLAVIGGCRFHWGKVVGGARRVGSICCTTLLCLVAFDEEWASFRGGCHTPSQHYQHATIGVRGRTHHLPDLWHSAMPTILRISG